MKFHVYDRMENGKFVPNGYPLDYEYIKDPTEYKTKFQKEKTVHWMGYNLISEDNLSSQLNDKLSSEVEDNFIYPVEQFGAFEKLIGEEEAYRYFCFLDHIKPDTLEKLRNGKGKIVIFAVEESRVHVESFIYLHKLLVKFKISPSNVIYLTGNNWSGYKRYKEWCQDSKIQDIIKVINTHAQMYLKGNDLIKGDNSTAPDAINRNSFVSVEEFNSQHKRKHRFLCYNRRIRPPRYVMLAMLHHNNLIKDNLVSFSIEKKHDLNCLGFRGIPDRPTMTLMLGKSELRTLYLSYYKDLMKMSPQVVDFDNLLDVMGPGCERKQPYLDTYFSIVTETSFNEDTWCLTEKVWRPMLHFHPFIVHGSPYTLRNIKELGFKTFHPYIDESYDEVESCRVRMELLTTEIKRICSMSLDEMHDWYWSMKDIMIHNRDLIYSYGKDHKTFLEKIVNKI